MRITRVKKGWASYVDQDKWHYVRDGVSLCGKWKFAGPIYAHDQKGHKPRGGDCAACWRALKTGKFIVRYRITFDGNFEPDTADETFSNVESAVQAAFNYADATWLMADVATMQVRVYHHVRKCELCVFCITSGLEGAP